MKANFHTHTYRCHHASGEDIEYVKSAIERGLEVLGFSDHAPYYFPGEYYSNFRMTPAESAEYVSSVLSLREEFSKDIKIYVGYEMEYYPKFFDKAIDIIKKNQCDYLILGQHFVGNEIGCRGSVSPSDSREELTEYTDEVVAAINTGKFFYVAHPDVLHFTGDTDFYREEMKRICVAAKETGTPLELNLLGIRDGRFYPVEEFWKIASAVGCKVILGCDAHRPCDMAVPSDIDAAYKMADKLGLDIIELKSPKPFI